VTGVFKFFYFDFEVVNGFDSENVIDITGVFKSDDEFVKGSISFSYKKLR
jgi:hypothetical protein